MADVGTSDLWGRVAGQDRALGQLRAAAVSPVHAYLLVGPRGSGKRQAALAFAAELLADGLDDAAAARVAHLVAGEQHPDLVVVERKGPYITMEQARDTVRRASLSPVEGNRQVLLLVDFHLVQQAGPALLKAIEEPPEGTTFVVLAEEVPPELETIASRCVAIEFDSLSREHLVEALVADGVAPDHAAEVAGAAGGDLGRARELVDDPGLLARRDAWRAVPAQLDGSGATVGRLVAELTESLDAAKAPLADRHAGEVADLQERIDQLGERGSGAKELAERHKREERRLRTDELVFGLATLARRYRDALAEGGEVAPLVRSLQAIQDSAESLERNPNETLLLQALLLQLSPVASPR
jgi:DNA polymerase-3 subunit delta'